MIAHSGSFIKHKAGSMNSEDNQVAAMKTRKPILMDPFSCSEELIRDLMEEPDR